MSKKRFESGRDESLFVYQREKIKDQLQIREFPWTEKQQKFIELALNKDTNFIICQAPPGVGKTLLSAYCALRLLNEKRVGTVFYVRNPIESSSKGIGFLSGDYLSKMEPWLNPLRDVLNELLCPSEINKLISEERLESIPIGFLKGRTFHVSCVIADQIEDLNLQEFLLTMSRLGKRSKMWLIGDFNQANVKNSGFRQVYNLFDNQESRDKGIHCLSFGKEDIKRNDVLSYVVGKFNEIIV